MNKRQKRKNFFNDNFFIKNRKADITVTILVIGVVGICILTILSFVGSNNERKADFLGIGLIETMNSIEEEADFYKETVFEGDYGNVFEKENIKIIVNEGNVEGNYSVTERKFPNVFATKEKVIVRVKYKK